LMVTQDSCQFVTDCLEFPVVSVEELDVNQIEVYPNPVSDFIQIKGLRNGRKIDVFNTMGKQVSSIVAENKTEELDFTDLAPGVYFLRISDDKGVSTFRIVKE
ncbi:T9SS type A sorting domain-containing protein, partial [Halocola ammonii]